jgi:hypothetical protein
MSDQSAIETKVECPACSPCPVCQDIRVVSPEERAHYTRVRAFPREECPRCTRYGKSHNCAVCSGTNAVTPHAASEWQQGHPNQRRASRPEMSAVNLDPRKDE